MAEKRGKCHICDQEDVVSEDGPEPGRLYECPECGELTCFDCWGSGSCQPCGDD